MKRLAKSILGITLLEIMLVLAIASMIIVMSVRYYQSATNSQQATAALQLVLAIAAAADKFGMGTGSYSAITSSIIAASLGVTTIHSPNGGLVTVVPAGSANPSQYAVTMVLGSQVCPSVAAQLASNTKFSGKGAPSCIGTGSTTLSYTYDSSK